MSWRPEGWENPYLESIYDIKKVKPGDKTTTTKESKAPYFEAGADAMLEVLRKKGKIETRSYRRERLADMVSFNNDYERTTEHCIIEHVRGTLVFIPDDGVYMNK
jgi:hypothetical protein